MIRLIDIKLNNGYKKIMIKIKSLYKERFNWKKTYFKSYVPSFLSFGVLFYQIIDFGISLIKLVKLKIFGRIYFLLMIKILSREVN